MADMTSPIVVSAMRPASTNRTVLVSFDPQSGWTFTPRYLVMDGRGSVILLRDPHDARWMFAAFDIDDPKQFHETILADRCIVVDDWTREGPYKYVVTVSLDGQLYQSPDPQIINSGP